jgi:thioredoxin
MAKNKIFYLLILVIFSFSFCTSAETDSPDSPAISNEKVVKDITSDEEFKKILEEAKDKLLGFDLYADWCLPCRKLSPLLEEIAKENKDKITFYKINVDKLPNLAAAFRVQGIPYVVFVKNMEGVFALTGLHPKDAYERAIDQYSGAAISKEEDKPSGELVEGIRVIQVMEDLTALDVFVYRGETVKLVMEPRRFQHSIHIPEYEISQDIEKAKAAEITFKAVNTGVFPIYCNGDCPQGDGAQAGKIVVMQYEAEGDAQYIEINTAQAKKMIAESNPLILDVRTPREYYDGHIEGSKLIPLSQLEDRLSEIAEYKDKDIIVYCRSGNRSVVAAEILIKNGFKKVYNLRSGFRDW